MWTRKEVKTRGKENFKRSYWGLVLLSIILSFLSGGFSSAGSSFSNVLNSSKAAGDTDALAGAANTGNLFSGLMDGSIDTGVLTGILVALGTLLVIGMIVAILLNVFLINPLTVGAQRYMVEADYEARKVGDLNLLGFPFKKGRYGNSVKVMFLMNLYLFLWSLLLFIPGIIKTYEYRMVPYILAENPELSSKQIFQLSKEMMRGNKWAAFVLDLSFLGWYILGAFTCGILYIFYVTPYQLMTNTALYDTLKQNSSIDYFDRSLDPAAAYADAGSSYEVYQDNGNDTL